MEILEISVRDEPKFNELALKYGSIFNSVAWLNIFGDGVKRYGIYNKGNELIGGFITYKEKKFFLSIYRNPPFTPTIGPFLKIEAQNSVAKLDTWKGVLFAIVEFIENLPYSIISCSLDKCIVDVQPFLWNKFKVSPGFTYLLDLSKTIEEIWKGMSNERRKNITKGIKDGLIVKKVEDLNTIRALVMKTFSRQSKLINEFFLNKILFEFTNNDNGFAFVTFNNDVPVACTFCIYDKNTAYYLLGGYDFENKHHGAGTLAMWEAIKYAKGLGLKYFDFEGSMVPQIEKYFRGFGGQLTPFYRINKARLPIEMILKLFKRGLF